MRSPTSLGPVSAYVRERIAELLDKRRVVVWYDPNRDFAVLVDHLDLPDGGAISATGSRLRARREAEAVYRRLDEAGGSPEARRNLLIYVPAARGATPEQQQQDPFEGFARCGATFGAQEAERLLSLAQLALPDHAGEIARLFREGQPTLKLLDALPAGVRFPLVRQALGTESPTEAIVEALSRSDAAERLRGVPGALAELARLAQTELGLPPGPSKPWSALRDRLATYLLVSELAFDLPGGLPSSLATVPHAEAPYRQRALDVCDRLRETDAGREAYLQLASAVERDLRLPAMLGANPPLGARDTFPSQERARLRTLVQVAQSGDLIAARNALTAAERSVWRRDPERTLLWQVAQRCLTFLELAAEAETKVLPGNVRTLVEAYVGSVGIDGLWKLDRAHRLYEQAGAQCAQDEEVEPLIQVCRTRYRAVIQRAQSAFQMAVKIEGWPPDGARRQTRVFDAYVAPELAERRKTAYFLVDSLRYEMGCDLAKALQELGAVSVEGVASVLPTTTPFGMAALVPGADGAFTVVEHRGDLVPAVGGVPLPGLAARKALLADRFGDRFVDIDLDDLLSTPQRRLGNRLGVADFLVVWTRGIDELGEATSLFRARKVMSEVIGELQSAAIRLASLGFQTLVFAADHGHMLVPEILPGDVLVTPPGRWLARKRRSLLGQAQASPPGVIILRAQDVGILGPVDDFAVAADFKTFQGGAGYFHEGLSLQECIVPVVVVRAQKAQMTSAGEQVTITYRSDRFTSSVIGLKLTLRSMFTTSLPARLEAYDGSGPKAKTVGQAGDCDARDPSTGEIVLPKDVETPVPVVVDPDFQGPSLEVRAIDPRTGAVLARLSLKNARID
ncbi:MAG: PglZ domain-containing protein [Chloroflexi bacterium]|nr:PglZ domain-containing protein [Chloroflexota bacterium]